MSCELEELLISEYKYLSIQNQKAKSEVILIIEWLHFLVFMLIGKSFEGKKRLVRENRSKNAINKLKMGI